MIRPIAGAIEYKLRSADEMHEVLYAASEAYVDIEELDAHLSGIELSVKVNAQIIAKRTPGERELVAMGIL